MGVTRQATLRIEDWTQRGMSQVLSNFRGPAIFGDKVQGVTVGKAAEVEWKTSSEMKKSRS